jgi:hypothetical protein
MAPLFESFETYNILENFLSFELLPMKKYLYSVFVFSFFLFVIPYLLHSLANEEPVLVETANFLNTYNSVINYVSIALGTSSGLFLSLLLFKERKTAAIIEKAVKRDAAWDLYYLKNRARLAFYQFYDALIERDFSVVPNFLTQSFYKEFFQENLVPGVTNYEVVNPIEITDTHIIGVEDRLDNTCDSYSAYISGYIICPRDYSSISNELIVDKTSFKVICSFLREKDEWKLNDINDKVNLLKLLTQKLVYEE